MKVTAITKNRLQYFWRILVIILLNLLMIAIATRGAVLETIGLGGLFSSEQEAVQTLSKVGSRGEPYSGQVAVGAVILNRIEHPSFPNSLAGVIYQPGAFSCLTDGGVNAPVADSAYRAARDAINGQDPSGGAIYYYNPDKSTNKWIFSRPVITVIGNHRFCS